VTRATLDVRPRWVPCAGFAATKAVAPSVWDPRPAAHAAAPITDPTRCGSDACRARAALLTV